MGAQKMKDLTIGDIQVEVIRKDIKNMHLSVHPPNGRVRLAVPVRIDEDSIRFFAISKLSWIKKQQDKFRRQERIPPRRYVSGECHYVAGQRYRLNIIETTIGKQRVEKRNNDYLDLYVRPGGDEGTRERIMQEFYRSHLKKEIPAYVAEWEPIIGVAVKEWKIKRMKTKWGTCNPTAKRIWINLELAKKNPRCLVYIIVHEMVHLLERQHNDRFKAYMDQFLPDWRSVKEELSLVSWNDREPKV